MTRDAVNKALQTYNACKARCGHLNVEIELCQKLLARLEETALASAALEGNSVLDDMPKSTTVGSAVERIAIKYADGYKNEEILRVQDKIKALTDERQEKLCTVVFVDAWMQVLKPKEAFVVKAKVIDGVYWRELIFQFNKEFGEIYSKNGLNKIKTEALEKIYAIAE